MKNLSMNELEKTDGGFSSSVSASKTATSGSTAKTTSTTSNNRCGFIYNSIIGSNVNLDNTVVIGSIVGNTDNVTVNGPLVSNVTLTVSCNK